MYGNSSRKLFMRIMGNSELRMIEFPLFSFPFLRIVFISLCSLFNNRLLFCYFVMGIVKLYVYVCIYLFFIYVWFIACSITSLQ
jgi:hypothetical protein